MYYRLVNPRLDLAININYYWENKFGIDIFKTQTSTTHSPLVVVVFIGMKIIHSQLIHLLNKMYEMQ
jgi:hypothetical protein